MRQPVKYANVTMGRARNVLRINVVALKHGELDTTRADARRLTGTDGRYRLHQLSTFGGYEHVQRNAATEIPHLQRIVVMTVFQRENGRLLNANRACGVPGRQDSNTRPRLK
jgi:hypothetical protein